MQNFQKYTSNVTDHFRLISFVSPSLPPLSDISDKVVSPETSPKFQLSGEEASQFYKEVISSSATTANCLPSSSKVCMKIPQTLVCKKVPKNTESSVSSILNNNRLTIFHHAQNGNVKEIEQFLAEQCNVDIQDMYGWTPLMCATFEGHYTVVEFLLKCGANINIKNKQGLTAFDKAIKNDHKAIIHLFKSGIVTDSFSCENQVEDSVKYCDSCKCSYTDTKVHERSIAHLLSKNKRGSSSTYYHIPENNKGFQIMLKKGWDKNKGLGVDSNGRKFPIKTILKSDRACIGGKKEIAKVTHFGPNDTRSVKKKTQPTLNVVRERKLKRWEAKRQEAKNHQFEIAFRREFHL